MSIMIDCCYQYAQHRRKGCSKKMSTKEIGLIDVLRWDQYLMEPKFNRAPIRGCRCSGAEARGSSHSD